MLTEQEISEIQEHLAAAHNPLFYFDNDPDGLCSFLLLQRSLGTGKGVPIKSFPELDESYFRKVDELGADYIFILDKPVVSRGFLEQAHQHNIPVVWIDHHEVDEEERYVPEYVHYYNPTLHTGEEKDSVPVTYLCYQVLSSERQRQDMWLALVGCISDKFFPPIYDEFQQAYPDLSMDTDSAFDLFYSSRIGKIARIFSFALKDRTTNVINMIRFLMGARNPYEVLEETTRNHSMHFRFRQIDAKYQRLVKKAEEVEKNSKNMLFFQYGGDLSISSDLSNELSYRYPGKYIFVVYITGVKANISGRGPNVKDLVLRSISGLDNATGGGHDDAVGAQVGVEDLERFRESLVRLVSKTKDINS